MLHGSLEITAEQSMALYDEIANALCEAHAKGARGHGLETDTDALFHAIHRVIGIKDT